MVISVNWLLNKWFMNVNPIDFNVIIMFFKFNVVGATLGSFLPIASSYKRSMP
jgi:hypothetical protein